MSSRCDLVSARSMRLQGPMLCPCECATSVASSRLQLALGPQSQRDSCDVPDLQSMAISPCQHAAGILIPVRASAIWQRPWGQQLLSHALQAACTECTHAAACHSC